MNLILDIGNTIAKAAIYKGNSLVKKERLETFSRASLESFLGNVQPAKAIISSVATEPADVITLVRENIKNVHHLTWRSEYPFKIKYSSPETLGVDRLAAAAGALLKFNGHDLLVIDAGSAVTFDIVAGGEYLGGSISPGLTMRLRALHEFTVGLPLAELSESFSFPGASTLDAIAGGVLMGLVFEINEYIRTFEKRYNALIPVITGGDGEKLSSLTERRVICYPDLVTDGLNYLLEYNAKN
ncbi:MAG TPA: type III pantothenate kinase [Bacteroidales bacterium]|nr:type III pantothenate kinase [Bacteroidales bacterium]